MDARSTQHTPSSAAEPRPVDVFVIGGGPAGSTVATLLARQGRSVVVAEKEHHPRFHIGESLLPANGPLFDQLGVRADIERIGMPKWGAEFVSPQHDMPTRVEFGDAWDRSMPYAWQVRRSEFDDILFRNAEAAGVQGLQGCQVRSVRFDADGADVHATLDDGSTAQWRAAFVIDASGRDTLLANQMGTKQRNPKHNSAALFGHFRGAKRLDGKLAGNITIFWFEHGWFWFIPLADGVTSVGATCWPKYLKTRDKPLREFFLDTVAMCQPLAERLAGAELVDDQVHATGNYSYSSSVCHGDRWLLLGDAYAFIDPVFSSGVHLAMTSAFEGAKVVQAFFEQPAAVSAARRSFEQVMAKGPREFSWFIFRMTNPAMRDLFMRPSNPMGVKSAVLSLLAGDIYGRTPFWNSLRLFKLIYWGASLASAGKSWKAWRMRRQLIADAGPLKGETVMVKPR